MRITLKPIHVLLLVAAGLAGIIVSTRWTDHSSNASDPIVEAIPRSDLRPSVVASVINPDPFVRDATLTLPQRDRVAPDTKGEAFVTRSWLPPPPPVRVAPPPPPPPPVIPVAPPLPFTFVGLIEQGSAKPQAFLSKGDVLLVVAAGDILDNNTYRVDTLNAQQIVITYLPLNTPQPLNILGTTK